MLKSKIISKYGKEAPMIWESEMFEQEARMATILIEKWGMVACEVDGEDTTGRQKFKLMTPKKLIARAFNVAALTLAEAKKRGLVHTVAELPYSVELSNGTDAKVDTSTPTTNI